MCFFTLDIIITDKNQTRKLFDLISFQFEQWKLSLFVNKISQAITGYLQFYKHFNNQFGNMVEIIFKAHEKYLLLYLCIDSSNNN